MKLNLTTKKATAIEVALMSLLVLTGMLLCVTALASGSIWVFPVFNLVIYAALLFYGIYGYKIPHGNLLKYIMLGFSVLTIVLVIISPGSSVQKILSGLATVLIAFIAGRLNRFKQVIAIGLVAFALIVSSGIYILAVPPTDANSPVNQEQGSEAAPEDPSKESYVVPVGSSKSAMMGDGKSEKLAPSLGFNVGTVSTVSSVFAPNGEDTFVSGVYRIYSPFTPAIQWGIILLTYCVRYFEHKEAGLEDKKKA